MSLTNNENQDLQLKAYFEKRMPHYLELLRQMVDTNSFTSNAVGVNALGQLTSQKFAELGFISETIMSSNPLHGDHLVLRRMSNGTGSEGTVAFVSHLDTVFPPEEEEQNDFTWRVDDDLIYGPGTVDIKGGTLVIFMVLEALLKFEPKLFDNINWVILLNAAEEELVSEFKDHCFKALPEKVDACLVFEGGRSRDGKFSLVTSRKGRITYRLEVTGRAAHAGSAHENGANAVVQLAATIGQISKLTNYNNEITFNVGSVSGGTVMNRVPHLAEASGEARAFSPEVLDEAEKNLLALEESSSVHSAGDGYPCVISVNITGKWRPWPSNNGSEKLFDSWQKAAKKMDYEVLEERRGGLSDGNWLWDSMPTLDGLGPSGGNAHCSERSRDGSKDQEFIRISSLIPKATLNVLGILQLMKNKPGID